MQATNQILARLLIALIIAGASGGMAQSGSEQRDVILLSWRHTVKVREPGAIEVDAKGERYQRRSLPIGTELETLERSRADVQIYLSRLMIGPNTFVRFERSTNNVALSVPHIQRGSVAVISWGRGGSQAKTDHANLAWNNTEFVVEVGDDGMTKVTMIEGKLEMSNDFGNLEITTGEQGIVRPGEKPQKTVVINARNAVQWRLYYAAFLNPDDLGLNPTNSPALANAVSNYLSGDLLASVSAYPTNITARSEQEKVFLAALNLVFGEVGDAESLLASSSASSDIRDAFADIVAATTFSERPVLGVPGTASAWLARSYYLQSRWLLPEAREAARKAVELAPDFGFAWSRLAELDLSFGRTGDARRAIDQALSLSPRNAQAIAVKGFLAAQLNQNDEALNLFDSALDIDPRLGNAWLGRGLVLFRQRDTAEALQSFLSAAASEPQRAVLRSYIAKGLQAFDDPVRARKEIEIAKEMDPGDPTAWLYSALLHYADNRVNQAVRDLEESRERNDNRSVYRSRLLLDQDRATRTANLARIYKDVGLHEVSLREGARAVEDDYANYSAHLFLADSFNAMRDIRQFTLRYETPWFTEYLMANLLSPADAGIFSPALSEGEYGRFFDNKKFGLRSGTEYLSNGSWSQSASHFGRFGQTSYAAEAYYSKLRGWRPNEDLDELTFSARLKHSITEQDTLFFQLSHVDIEGEDLAQYYDPAQANRGARSREVQEPFLLAGYRREWQPGVQTLLVGGYVRDQFAIEDPFMPVVALQTNASGVFAAYGRDPGAIAALPSASLEYHGTLELGSIELQQIFQRDNNTVIAGARLQHARIDTRSTLGESSEFLWANAAGDIGGGINTTPSVEQSLPHEINRAAVYLYDIWNPWEPVQITGGLTYEHQTYPSNFRNPPLFDRQDEQHFLAPKLGIVWRPGTHTVVRAAYARSLGGISMDQSFRIEPSQVAGFAQNFRNVLPESVTGSVAGVESDTFSFGLEQRVARSTWLGLELQRIESSAERMFGGINSSIDFPFPFNNARVSETLGYQESSAAGYIYLFGEYFSAGARYRVTQSQLQSAWQEVAPAVYPFSRNDFSAVLHEITLTTRFNHPSRLFAGADTTFYNQSNHGYRPSLPGDAFWHLNIHAGYRFPRNRGEVRAGILNFTDQDYRLNPLNLHNSLPRERTFFVSLIVSL